MPATEKAAARLNEPFHSTFEHVLLPNTAEVNRFTVWTAGRGTHVEGNAFYDCARMEKHPLQWTARGHKLIAKPCFLWGGEFPAAQKRTLPHESSVS